jgi:serine/threonine-protein kinase
MGEVWRADHLSLKSSVAVKLLNPDLISTEEAATRFEREAQAAAALRSPHVVHTIDHGVDDGVPYMVMELLEGESLADRLRRERVLTPRQTMRIMTHVARALSKAHEAGIVHRDIKPENIFIVRNDDEELCKLVDFGVVKIRTSQLANISQTKSGALVGTPLYMSPEQLRAKETDHRADLWSLAIVAYECLTGAMPYSADSLADLVVQITREAIPKPSQIASGIPAGFDDWFERATQRDPTQRFQSAREMVEALRKVLDIAPDVTARLSIPSIATSGHHQRATGDAPTLAASSTELAAPKAKPSRNMATIAIGVFLVVCIGAVALWMKSRPEAKPTLTGATATVTTTAEPVKSSAIPSIATEHVSASPDPLPSETASASAMPHSTKPIATARPSAHPSAAKSAGNPLLF